MPSIAEPLSATAQRWRKAVAPHAERIAARFAAAADLSLTADEEVNHSALPERFRTPLTQANRTGKRRNSASSSRTGLKLVCRRCGTPLGRLTERAHCHRCREELQRENAAKGRKKLRQLRAEGRDRRSDASMREQKRRRTARMNREIAEWEAENPGEYDKDEFGREVTPRLKHLRGQDLVDATGLALVTCNQIRRGTRVPHPRHWAALRKLSEAAPAVEETEPDFYRATIAPRLTDFSVQEIAEASGLSASYCKKIRKGERMPRPRHWEALKGLVAVHQAESHNHARCDPVDL